jgi:hypothetical protein
MSENWFCIKEANKCGPVFTGWTYPALDLFRWRALA